MAVVATSLANRHIGSFPSRNYPQRSFQNTRTVYAIKELMRYRSSNGILSTEGPEAWKAEEASYFSSLKAIEEMLQKEGK